MTQENQAPSQIAEEDKAPYARPVLVNMGSVSELTMFGALGALSDATNGATASSGS